MIQSVRTFAHDRKLFPIWEVLHKTAHMGSFITTYIRICYRYGQCNFGIRREIEVAEKSVGRGALSTSNLDSSQNFTIGLPALQGTLSS